MGIVVCVTLLFALSGAIYTCTPMLSIAMGLWNSLWYGVRHLGSFWGHAALATGVVMLFAGIILWLEDKVETSPALAALLCKTSFMRWPVVVGLLAGFLLYAVTLIQLNLSYQIIY